MIYRAAMATGSIEPLKGGSFRVSVYAGRDPITGRKRYLKESHPTLALAAAAKERVLVQVEAQRRPTATRRCRCCSTAGPLSLIVAEMVLRLGAPQCFSSDT